ncbi:MAG TPA: hypothetical protein VH561_10630 [Micromonosporaceae bacterium]|jgi:hypothetical protein
MRFGRHIATAVLVTAVVIPVAACSSGTPNQPPGNSSTASDTPAADATTTGPATLDTAEGAATRVYDAWQANDKASALEAATQSAVDALFAQSWQPDTYFFDGCSEAGSPSSCQYNTPQGTLIFTVEQSGSTWQVTAVQFGNAG